MNKSNLSLSLLSIAMLLILPHCAQSRQETTDQSAITANPKVKLFVYHFCRYCQKVINALRESGNLDKVLLVDANKPEYLAQLKQLNHNNTQCPFIFDEENNIKMLESDDIIKYLQKRFANQ